MYLYFLVAGIGGVIELYQKELLSTVLAIFPVITFLLIIFANRLIYINDKSKREIMAPNVRYWLHFFTSDLSKAFIAFNGLLCAIALFDLYPIGKTNSEINLTSLGNMILLNMTLIITSWSSIYLSQAYVLLDTKRREFRRTKH